MGARGIRRRKHHRALPTVDPLPPGDDERVFGRFRWGAYSPAGSLERSGFFWRQLGRRRADTETWRFSGYALHLVVGVSLAIAVVVYLVSLIA
jgi:hypothetical protein